MWPLTHCFYSDRERGLLARSKVELFNENFVLKFLYWQENRNVPFG